jgi:hypothetical protein
MKMKPIQSKTKAKIGPSTDWKACRSFCNLLRIVGVLVVEITRMMTDLATTATMMMTMIGHL